MIVSWGIHWDVHAFVSEKVKTWTSGAGVLAEAAELYSPGFICGSFNIIAILMVLHAKSGTKL